MTATSEALQAENAALRQRVAELEAVLSQLQQQDKQLRIILEMTTDWAWEVDTNGVYTYVSPNIATILGYEPQDVVGKTPFDLMLPEEAERVMALFGQLVATQQPIQLLENVAIHKDGHRVVQETSGIPFYDESGVFCGYRGVDRDITQCKEIEAELRQSQALLQGVFDNAPAAIYVRDTHGCFTLVNQNHAAALGRTPQQIIGTYDYEIFSPETMQNIRAIDQHVLDTGTSTQQEESIPLTDGVHTYLSTRFPLFDEQGTIFAVGGIATDITERKQQEEELRVFKTVVENAVDGIGMADTQGCLTYVNPFYGSLTGYGQTMIGMPLDDLFAVDIAQIQTIVQNVIGQGYWLGDLLLKKRNGTIILTQLSVFPVPDEQGSLLGTVAIVRDITEQKQAEAERAALQQQVIDAQQAVIRELSSPLLPIADQVLVMPLVGSIDSTRSKLVMETLLEGVRRHQASLVILDITGVQVVDTQVANAFIQAAQAVELLGAQVMITGIQPSIAQTLVHLGVDLHGIITRSTLQDGVAYTLSQTTRRLNGSTHQYPLRR